MPSNYLQFPDEFAACGVCAGTGTVVETNAYGVPIRKMCRKCNGQGSIRKPHRPGLGVSDTESDSDNTDKAEYEPPESLEGIAAEYEKVLDEAQAEPEQS